MKCQNEESTYPPMMYLWCNQRRGQEFPLLRWLAMDVFWCSLAVLLLSENNTKSSYVLGPFIRGLVCLLMMNEESLSTGWGGDERLCVVEIVI